jgi:hypothetical protein
MNLLLSYFFSAIDFSALIVLTLCTFRFRLKHHVKEIVISSLIMSFISKCFMLLHLTSIAPVIQLLILIVIFKFLFRESVLYSFVSNVLGFLLFITIETTFFSILIRYNIIQESDLGGDPKNITYILQVSESIIMYLVAFGMKSLNHGFGFSDNLSMTKNSIKTTNIYFVIVSSLAVFVLFMSLYMILVSRDVVYLAISVAVLIVLTILLIYMYIKRDKEHYK